jgi:hypothetical protein
VAGLAGRAGFAAGRALDAVGEAEVGRGAGLGGAGARFGAGAPRAALPALDVVVGLDRASGLDRAAGLRRALFRADRRLLERVPELFLPEAARFAPRRVRLAGLAGERFEARRRDAVFFAFFAFLAALRAALRGAAAFLDSARLGLLAIRRSFQRVSGETLTKCR